jgi:flagellar protein FlbD
MATPTMIELTRLNQKKIFINPDLMKSIEETPDTIISMINGDQYLVLEKVPEIIEKIIYFRVTVVRRADTPSYLVKGAQAEGA